MKTLVCRRCGAKVEGCDDRAVNVICSLCVATGQYEPAGGKFQKGKYQRRWLKHYQEKKWEHRRREA